MAGHLLGDEACAAIELALPQPREKRPDNFYSGGEGGIRTHGTRKGSTVFETARFNHSRTSPNLHYLISQPLTATVTTRF